MRVAIITGALDTAPDLKGMRQPEDWLPMYKEAGYDSLSIALTAQAKKDVFFIAQDNWKERTYAIKELADKLGIKFVQGHLPFIKQCILDKDVTYCAEGGKEYYDEIWKRCYEAAAIFGIPFVTQHPLTYLDCMGNEEENRKRNVEFYAPYVEYGAKLGVGTAFENMRKETPMLSFAERYCENAFELARFADAFDNPLVGCCWDTGHANDSGLVDQGTQIRHLGKRLKNTHLNDNHYGARDQHQFPWMGEVKWDDVLKALIDIDYAGALTYEVGMGIHHTPVAFQPELIKFAHDNGMYMLKKYEQFRKEAGK